MKEPVEVIRPEYTYIVLIRGQVIKCESRLEVFTTLEHFYGFVPPYVSRFVYHAKPTQEFNTPYFSIHCKGKEQ